MPSFDILTVEKGNLDVLNGIVNSPNGGFNGDLEGDVTGLVNGAGLHKIEETITYD